MINNVVYNWGPNGEHNMMDMSDYNSPYVESLLNYQGNFYKQGEGFGSGSAGGNQIWASAGDPNYIPSGTRILAKNNIGPNRTTNTGDDWTTVSDNFDDATMRVESAPFTYSGATILSPTEGRDDTLANAGSRLAERH